MLPDSLPFEPHDLNEWSVTLGRKSVTFHARLYMLHISIDDLVLENSFDTRHYGKMFRQKELEECRNNCINKRPSSPFITVTSLFLRFSEKSPDSFVGQTIIIVFLYHIRSTFPYNLHRYIYRLNRHLELPRSLSETRSLLEYQDLYTNLIAQLDLQTRESCNKR